MGFIHITESNGHKIGKMHAYPDNALAINKKELSHSDFALSIKILQSGAIYKIEL